MMPQPAFEHVEKTMWKRPNEKNPMKAECKKVGRESALLAEGRAGPESRAGGPDRGPEDGGPGRRTGPEG